MGIDWKKKLTSRKFWVAVGSALFIILNEGLNLGINRDVYWAIVTPTLGYILGEAYVDGQATSNGREPLVIRLGNDKDA